MISEATRSPQEVAEELRPALLRLARNLRRETEALGVTSHQVTLLWLVRSRPGLSLRELALEEGISAPSLSGHVDRLEAAGLLRRVRSTDDRRRVGLGAHARGSVAAEARPCAAHDVARRAPGTPLGRGARAARRRPADAVRPAGTRLLVSALALRISRRTFRACSATGTTGSSSRARWSRSSARGCRTSRSRGS